MILIRIKRHAKRKGRLVHHRLDYNDRCGQCTQNSVYTGDATMQTGGSTHTRTRRIRKLEQQKKKTIESSFHSAHVRAFAQKTLAFRSRSVSVQNETNFLLFRPKIDFSSAVFCHTQHSIKKDIGGVRMQQRIGHTDDLTHDNKIIIVKSPFHCSHCSFSSPSPRLVGNGRQFLLEKKLLILVKSVRVECI